MKINLKRPSSYNWDFILIGLVINLGRFYVCMRTASTQFLQLKKKIIQLSSAASLWNVGTTSLWVGNIAKDYTSITENLSKILACLQIIEAQ